MDFNYLKQSYQSNNIFIFVFALKETGEAKLLAETMGMDFQHCRVCVPAVGRAEIGRIRNKKGSS
jgi:hypothetical protein